MIAAAATRVGVDALNDGAYDGGNPETTTLVRRHAELGGDTRRRRPSSGVDEELVCAVIITWMS
jgi:hypothetical protein